jgi:type VI secretion system VasD/TssJ family lipoprotein
MPAAIFARAHRGSVGPVTSRLAQALIPSVRGTATAVAVGLLLAASCKGRNSAPPVRGAARVQLLVRTSDRANIGENGQSWPTLVTVYQLSGSAALEELDADAIKEQGEAALGEEFLDKKEVTAFPKTLEAIEMQLKPKATHLLIVASFRQPLGTAWYATYTVPTGLKDTQCSATAKDADPPTPCVYLAIEGSELVGGGNAPANFRADEFGVVCTAVGPAKKKSKKKGPPKLPDQPTAPKDPTPKTPTTPKAPSQPTLPKSPVR